MGRKTLIGATVLIAAVLFGLGSPAGAENYPPKTTTKVTVEAKTVAKAPVAQAAPVAAERDSLPFTGGNASQLIWAGGALVVAGAALVGRGRRRTARS
jgi:LPXTG-motif cell wall-anchored protein